MAARTVALGFQQVELGYFTRAEELPAWEVALAREGLSVSSVHAFLAVASPGPERYSLAAVERPVHEAAVGAFLRALEVARAFGATAIVVHGGRVQLREPRLLFGSRPYRSQLEQAFLRRGGVPDMELAAQERALRAEAAPAHLAALAEVMAYALPQVEAAGLTVAFENLPGLEAFPDPAEMAWLRHRFPTPALGAWYDIGHGERKARVGDWPVPETLDFTGAFTVGVHIHDVRGLLEDHRAPGEGTVDFRALQPLLCKPGLIRVFEPSPEVTPERLRQGLRFISALVAEGA